MKWEPTKTSYTLELTYDQMIKLMAHEKAYWDAYGTDEEIIYLDDQLEKLGCLDLEYNGHFGAAIFIALETESDTSELRAKIESIILNIVGNP